MAKRNRRVSKTPLGGAASRPPLKQTPFPGYIDENKWTIREGKWPSFIVRDDLEGEGGIMQVPLDDTDAARKLRLHEQAHVAWTPMLEGTPEQLYDVEARTLGACEDARMIHIMNTQNEDWKRVNETANILPPWLIERHKADFQRLAAKLAKVGGETEDPVAATGPPVIPLVEAARLIASSRGYREASAFNAIASDAGLGWITGKVDEMHNRHIVEKVSVFRKLAGKLVKKKPEQQRWPTFEDTVAYAQELEEFFENIEDQIEDQNEAMAELGMEPQQFYPELIDEGEGKWGDLILQEVPLTERLRGDPSRKTRATDMGAIPRYMHRYPTDQRIFGRRRKHRRFQGTVLIDHSGSMSLLPEQVDEILHRWPAVTIATYSGNAADGVLRIVAKNGRRAGVEYLGSPAAGANVIDGPALDWLAKQKGPRVWISDGHVTGIGEMQTPFLLADAAMKVRRGRIKRIPDVKDLIRD